MVWGLNYMRSKKVFIIVLFILILLLFSSIVIWRILVERVNREKGETKHQAVTIEFMIKKYGFLKEDLEGIDLDKVLKKSPWTIADCDTIINKEEVIQLLKKEQERINRDEALKKHCAEVNLGYLFAADEYTGEYPDFNTLKYLAFTQEFETFSVSNLIDFENSRFCDFTPESWVSSDYSQSSKVTKLTQDHKEKIIQALKDGNIMEWKHYYGDKKFKGDIYWSVGLEFQDGLVISYYGTAGDDGFPDEYDEMLITISNLFTWEPNIAELENEKQE